MPKITESIKEVQQYIYGKMNNELKVIFDYKTFVIETNSPLSKDDFLKCVWFLINGKYVEQYKDSTGRMYPSITTPDKVMVIVLPLLIREVEDRMN